ncbi:MAG: flagellar basal body L-ring protein FlgH [Planctomycetes bacterium]|nr:flagellar basal body L-ring protein FlgH [Planctomycetota bacterium]
MSRRRSLFHTLKLLGWSGVFAGLATAIVSDADLRAESLWKRRHRRSAFLFTDNRPRNVGDIITIQIEESLEIDIEEDRTLEKDTELERDFDFDGALSGDTVTKVAAAEFNLNDNSNRSFETNSEFDSERDLNAAITVVVIDVLPNGTMLVEGTRTTTLIGESRIIRVTGLVRPDDILFEDSTYFVRSRNVGNFHIYYEGSGLETQFTRPGWFSRVLNRVWPY